MTRHRTLLAIPLVALALAGCNTPPTQEQSGMVVGGILGGVIGHQVGRGSGRTVATILGTIVGASIGGNIGRSMDETDRLKTAHALESVRTSVPSTWVNPDTRNQYTVTPTRTYESAARPLSRILGEGADWRPTRNGLRHRLPAGRWQLEGGQLSRQRPGCISACPRAA